MNRPDELSLKTLLNGEAIARFDEECRRVADNILDPNTPAEKAREVHLVLKVTPNKRRSLASAKVDIYSKLARDEPAETELFIGQHMGTATLSENNVDQGDLFTDPVHDAAEKLRAAAREAGATSTSITVGGRTVTLPTDVDDHEADDAAE